MTVEKLQLQLIQYILKINNLGILINCTKSDTTLYSKY